MLNNIQEVIADIAQGKIIIVIDDEDRENEGDFICAAEKITAEIINFMATYGRGLICCPITTQRAQKLDLPLMVNNNTCPLKTAFTISVDAKKHLTTGISTIERANTIKVLSRSDSNANELVRPGHIFPLIAHKNGVLGRRGQTEAGVDLARLAKLDCSAVICEIMNNDGTMARLPQLKKIAIRFKLKITSVEDIVSYINKNNQGLN